MQDRDSQHYASVPHRAAQLGARPARQRWAFGLWIVQVLVTVGVIAVTCFNVESIVVGFPVLTVVGFVLAFVVRPIASWPATAFALSAPVVCAAGALLIALRKLMPPEAQAPVSTLLVFYGLIIAPVAIVAIWHIQEWPARESTAPAQPWQYSLKSLLALMTAACIVTAILSFAIKTRLDFPLVFSSFALITLLLAALIVRRIVAERRK